jgi:hypothetical protein
MPTTCCVGDVNTKEVKKWLKLLSWAKGIAPQITYPDPTKRATISN